MDFDRYLSQVAVPEVFPAGQKAIKSSSVVVVGVGGTGSTMAEMMVRMGVGRITIVDDDIVESSNLNRQAMYRESDIGLKKVDVAKSELLKINSDVEVEALDERLTIYNAEDIISYGKLTLDGTDNYSARGAINESSFRLKKPWVFTAVEGTFGYAKAIIPGKTSCLSCFGYPQKGEGVSCTIQGVIPSAVRAVSSLAITLAMKILLGKEESGDLIYLDVWKPMLEILPIPRNDDCAVCGRKGAD